MAIQQAQKRGGGGFKLLGALAGGFGGAAAGSAAESGTDGAAKGSAKGALKKVTDMSGAMKRRKDKSMRDVSSIGSFTGRIQERDIF